MLQQTLSVRCRFRRAAKSSASSSKPKRRIVPGTVPTTEYRGTEYRGSGSQADSLLTDPVCDSPEYSVYTWVMCLVAIATCLKLYFMVKVALASFFVVSHSILILCLFPVVSTARDPNSRS